MYMTAATTAKHWAESTLRQHPARARGHSSPNFCHAHTKSPLMPSPERQKENMEMDMCPGKTGSILCFSIRINKHRDSSICAVGDSTPGYPFG